MVKIGKNAEAGLQSIKKNKVAQERLTEASIDKVTIRDEIEAWLLTLPSSMEYAEGIKWLIAQEFIDINMSVQGFSLVNHDAIMDRIKAIQEQDQQLKRTYVAVYISFARFLSHAIQGVVTKPLYQPEGHKKVKIPEITEAQWGCFLQTLSTFSQQNRLMAELVLQGGLFSCSIPSLTTDKIDWIGGTIVFHQAKRGFRQEIIIAYPEDFIGRLREHVGDRTGYVFITRTGHQFHQAILVKIFALAGQIAGLPFNVMPQWFFSINEDGIVLKCRNRTNKEKRRWIEPARLTTTQKAEFLSALKGLSQRNYLVAELMVPEAQSINEVLSLQTNQIDWERGTICFHKTKSGKKKRIVAYSPDVMKQLKEYVGKRHGDVFITRDGKRLRTMGLMTRFLQAGRIARIPYRVSPMIFHATIMGPSKKECFIGADTTTVIEPANIEIQKNSKSSSGRIKPGITDDCDMREKWGNFFKRLNEINQRDCLIAELVLQGGKSEQILSLQTDRIRWSEKEIILFIFDKKGNRKNIIVSCCEEVMDKLKKYVGNRKGYVFSTSTGRRLGGDRLLRTFAQAGQAAGIPFKVTPNILRSTIFIRSGK